MNDRDRERNCIVMGECMFMNKSPTSVCVGGGSIRHGMHCLLLIS